MNAWAVSGSYFEVCNCEAICPCRSVGGGPGGRSTYGDCRFALSWLVIDGHADGVDLSNRSVVMAGWYDDDEDGSPWRVTLYVDDRASDPQFDALTNIFLGRRGGATFEQFARAIAEVHNVLRADITLSHVRRRWSIRASTFIDVAASTPVASDQRVTCGIPGHKHPGEEVVAERFMVEDDPLSWDFRGRCGFATNFAYRSEVEA